MKHNSFIWLAVVASVVCCNAVSHAQQTQKFTAAKHNEYGLVYSLPVTHFRIEVEMEKTIRKAGPYYQYAQRYLSVSKPITEDSQSWKLKSVKVTPYGVPDEDNRYLMQFKGGNGVFLMMTDDGLPLSINKEAVEDNIPKRPDKKKEEPSLTAEDLVMALPGELLVSESTAKRAQIAAQLIYKIRESRTAFATGEADQIPDGEALKLIMAQLDEQERALMALFCGRERTVTVTREFDYCPTGDVDKDVLFRISDVEGVVKSDNLGGDPVYISVEITRQGEMPVDDKGEPKKLPKNAVMYNIPGQARVTLRYDGKNLLDKEVDVSQFGINFGLDPSMFTNKKSPNYLLFYPETGSIKEIGTVTMQ